MLNHILPLVNVSDHVINEGGQEIWSRLITLQLDISKHAITAEAGCEFLYKKAKHSNLKMVTKSVTLAEMSCMH